MCRALLAFSVFLTLSSWVATGEQQSLSEHVKSVAAIAEKSTVQVIIPGISQGTGVWIGRDGFIATCWHVVKDVTQPNQIVIRAGSIFHFDFRTGEIISGAAARTTATVIAQDEQADVAILRVDANYLKDAPPTFFTSPDLTIKGQFDVPSIREPFPDLGEQVFLAGYPLQGQYLLFQFGNVAGQGEIETDSHFAQKKIRVFLSLTSNPGNSGGPVFDESGKLIGLLEGNLLSTMRDEKMRSVFYYRPQRDEIGEFVRDANGKPQMQLSESPLTQNSGISFIVPVHYVLQSLEQALSAHQPVPVCKGRAAIQAEIDPLLAGLAELLDQSRQPPFPINTPQESPEQWQREFLAYRDRSTAYYDEIDRRYQLDYALKVLSVRNDLGACGVFGHFLAFAYPDPNYPLIKSVRNELQTLIEQVH